MTNDPLPNRPFRVVLIGSESTGKTTLAKQLADHYTTEWVPEYGREYTEKRNTILEQKGVGEAGDWTSEEFQHIAQEQQRLENEAASRCSKILFGDTNAFATAIWHERYLGVRDPKTDEIANRDIVDIYLITANDVPFEADGIRDGEQVRDWMFETFVEEITKLGIPYEILVGDEQSRLNRAIQVIDEKIA